MRDYCSQCHYPRRTCVCPYVQQVHSPVCVWLLQHPKERSHAKNTARLVSLCIPESHCIQADDSERMHILAEQCQQRPSAVIYPNPHSQPWEAQTTDATQNFANLVFLDGSWRQAKGLWLAHPWLQRLPSFHFDDNPVSEYAIRHTDGDHHLSTLEAVAYCLWRGYKVDTGAMLRLQRAMQAHWQGPACHRRGHR